MKILLFGANGQVGWELQKSLSPLGDLIVCDRQKANFEDLSQLKELIDQIAPDKIVNAAAYTAVDKAESEKEKAYRINSEAVGVIAAAAKKNNAHLIHYSTDYVFDGSKTGAYLESDPVGPLNVYGHSKLAGEQAIIDSGCSYHIFRTSWVYGYHGHNFIKTILKLAQERDELNIVGDQYGTPTSAKLIANITAYVLKNAEFEGQKENGIYNLTPSGVTTWFEFAQYILDRAKYFGLTTKLNSDSVKRILSVEYAVPAQRPRNSRLDITKIQKDFNLSTRIELPDWRIHVSDVVSQLISL